MNMIAWLLAGSVVGHAQVRGGPHTPPGPGYTGLNMGALKAVEGTVTQVDVALGAQYPTIVINQLQIKLAPAWYILENDFEIKTGDVVRATVAASNNPADKYLYAVDIAKGTAFLKLRDANGFPLWRGGFGPGGQWRTGAGVGPGNGIGECEGCIDATKAETVTGAVDKITAEAGLQAPTLVLRLSDGTLLTIKIGPARILLASDFEITAGQALTVQYAVSSCRDELVALELTDSAGRKLILRHAAGTPAWL
jgi:hypothetical protein